MTPEQWFVVLSPAAFQFPAWMAYKRMLWIRWVGLHFVTAISLWYHSCRDAKWCRTSELQQDLDHIGGVWFATSIPILLAHFKMQAVEVLVQLFVIAGGIVLVMHNMENNIYYNLAFCMGVVIPTIAVTWGIRGGPPQMRVPWVVVGTILLTFGGIMFLVPLQDNIWIRGGWHIVGAIGAAFLIYGARDPNLLEGYHVLKDVFQPNSV